ncbi:MAG: NfeD family protein [Actinomycetota bacterium]
MAAWIWFAIFGALLVAEMLVVHLLFASLALAALAAGLTSLAGGSPAIQGLAFSIAGAISLLFLRPIALRHLKKQNSDTATNVDALVGQSAYTTTNVGPNGGQVKLSGEIWSAITDSGEIGTGEKVTVIAIDGATARVRRA